MQSVSRNLSSNISKYGIRISKQKMKVDGVLLGKPGNSQSRNWNLLMTSCLSEVTSQEMRTGRKMWRKELEKLQDVFQHMRSMWCSSSFGQGNKLRLYNSIVILPAIYVSETSKKTNEISLHR